MCPKEPGKYAGWTSRGPGSVTHARQVEGWGPDKEQSTDPPGWGFCTGPTTLSFKNLYATETATRNLTSAQDRLLESSPRTRMTADWERPGAAFQS